MSARGVLRAAVIGALKGGTLEGGALAPMAVFDAPPVRHSLPYAVIEEPTLQAFDAAGVSGRIGTLAITYHDAGPIGGERPLRLRVLIAAAEELIDALPTELAEGWRLGGLVLARSRLTRAKDGWVARSEWAVRVFRAN